MKKNGTLTLIPTPLSLELPLETVALELLRLKFAANAQENADTPQEKERKERERKERRIESILACEDVKVARRRWLQWGLPRESIADFVVFDEHNHQEAAQNLLKCLMQGQDVYLMSDCGLPAYFDPGQNLVDLCHKNRIKVTSTPFPHSMALAVSLSGFKHESVYFAGHLSHKDMNLRLQRLGQLHKMTDLVVLLETPYRLSKLLNEIAEIQKQLKAPRVVFLAMDLNCPEEELLRGSVGEIQSLFSSAEEKIKREFILCLAPLRSEKE